MDRRIFAAIAQFCLVLPLIFSSERGVSLCFSKNVEASAVLMPFEEAKRLFPSFSSLQKPINASEDLLYAEPPLTVSDSEIVSAAELLAKPNVDGGLIGGASLKTEDFVAVINAANQ